MSIHEKIRRRRAAERLHSFDGVPFRCEDCAGEGGFEVVTCKYGCPQGRGEGCTHARAEHEECGACKGTGLQQCELCGSQAATDVNDENERVCRFCLDGGSL